jgi:rod shape-determining protein MreD
VRRALLFAVAAAIAVIVQTSIARWVPFLPAGPDLILVLAVYLGLHARSAGGAVGAFLLGYLLDTMSATSPGLYCLTMTLVFGVVYLLSQRLWMENPVSNVAAVALGESLKISVVMIVFAFSGNGSGRWLSLSRTLGFEALFALACTPLVFAALDAQLGRSRSAGSREAR